MTLSRCRPFALLVLLAAALAPAAIARAEDAVSGRTPFPQGCGVTGQQTPDSEAEPYLAADPADPQTVVTVFQQDRFPLDGGALANLGAVTHDGGRTFDPIRFPHVSRCTGGAKERASDPWISFGGDGTAYAAHLTFDENPALGNAGLAGPTALSSQVSRDGGRTWEDPVKIVDDGIYDDREALTADPAKPGRAYVTWVRRLGAFGENGTQQFASTADGGRSWSPPRTIYTPGAARLPDPILLTVLPDSTLLDVFVVIEARSQVQDAPVPFDIMAMRSSDDGATWSAPVKIAQTLSTQPQDPDTSSKIRSLPIVSVAATPTGQARVVWNEIASEKASTIFTATSDDDGATWSAPREVAMPRAQAFLPAVAIGRDGSIGVLYDDTREDRPGDRQLTTDVWLDVSRDGGRTWRERRVSGPFDALAASETSSTGVAGHFLGDYQGIVALPGGFGAAYPVSGRAGIQGPSDILFARLPLEGGAPVRLARRLVLHVRPSWVRAGRRTRLTITVTRGGAPARSARVEVAGRRLLTDADGRVVVRVRPRRRAAGVRVHASRRGLRSATAIVRVRRGHRARAARVTTR